MHEGVVEGGVDVRHGEHLDALADLRPEGHLHLLGLLLLSLARSHSDGTWSLKWNGFVLLVALEG